MNEQETAKNSNSLVTLELSKEGKSPVLGSPCCLAPAHRLCYALAFPYFLLFDLRAAGFAVAPFYLALFVVPPTQLNMCQCLIVYKYREGKVKSNAVAW